MERNFKAELADANCCHTCGEMPETAGHHLFFAPDGQGQCECGDALREPVEARIRADAVNQPPFWLQTGVSAALPEETAQRWLPLADEEAGDTPPV
eukprot:1485683-Alexandrium_andersonii.AAC.1